MEILFITIASLFASLKAISQSRLAKQHTKTIADGLFFIACVFLTCTLITSPSLFKGINGFLLLMAALYGILSTLFQFFYLQAFRFGSTPISVLIVTTAMISPVIFSAIKYGEPFGIREIIGLVLILTTFVLNVPFEKKTERKRTSVLWILFISIAFLSTSVAMIVQTIYIKTAGSANSKTFIAYTYLIATALCFLLLLFMKDKSEEKKPLFNKKVIFPGLVVGSMLCCFQIVNNLALGKINATVFIPGYNCGTALLVTLISVLLFKEKMNLRQIISAILSVGAILLMAL